MDEKKIFEEMVNILKAYTKDVTLLEKAEMKTHILNDLKVNSARLLMLSLSVKMFMESASMMTKRIKFGQSATP